MFWLEFEHHLPFPWLGRELHLTQCVLVGYPTPLPAKWHLSLSNGLSRVRDSDRQTNHATEKRIGIGGIACRARAIPTNNDYRGD